MVDVVDVRVEIKVGVDVDANVDDDDVNRVVAATRVVEELRKG